MALRTVKYARQMCTMKSKLTKNLSLENELTRINTEANLSVREFDNRIREVVMKLEAEKMAQQYESSKAPWAVVGIILAAGFTGLVGGRMLRVTIQKNLGSNA